MSNLYTQLLGWHFKGYILLLIDLACISEASLICLARVQLANSLKMLGRVNVRLFTLHKDRE